MNKYPAYLILLKVLFKQCINETAALWHEAQENKKRITFDFFFGFSPYKRAWELCKPTKMAPTPQCYDTESEQQQQ